jgi:hypothetical protein
MSKPTSTDAEIVAAYRECGSIKQVVRECRCGPNRVRRLVAKLPPMTGVQQSLKSSVTPSLRTIPAREFVAQFDTLGKVRAAVKSLGGCASSDNDLRIALGIPAQQWAVIRGMDEFQKHQIEDKGKRYWASAALVAQVVAKKNETR